MTFEWFWAQDGLQYWTKRFFMTSWFFSIFCSIFRYTVHSFRLQFCLCILKSIKHIISDLDKMELNLKPHFWTPNQMFQDIFYVFKFVLMFCETKAMTFHLLENKKFGSKFCWSLLFSFESVIKLVSLRRMFEVWNRCINYPQLSNLLRILQRALNCIFF